MDIHPLASSSVGNCTLVRLPTGQSVLLDAGLTAKQLRPLVGFRLAAVDVALITHSHLDHARGVSGLLAAGVTCAMRQETADALGVAGHHRVQILEPQDNEAPRGPYMFGPWAVVPFDVQHDVPNLGFVVSTRTERLLYLTDTPLTRYRVEGLTKIVIEANHSMALVLQRVEAGSIDGSLAARIIRSHLGLERAIEVLKSNDLSRVTEIWLTHLSNSHSNAVEFKAAVQAATGLPTYVAPERGVAA